MKRKCIKINNHQQHRLNKITPFRSGVAFGIFLLSFLPWGSVYSSTLPQPRGPEISNVPGYFFYYILRWKADWFEAGNIGDQTGKVVGRCVYSEGEPQCENVGEYTFPYKKGTISQIFHEYSNHSSPEANYFWHSVVWKKGSRKWACVQYYYRNGDSDSTRHFIGNRVCTGNTPVKPLTCTIPATLEINYGSKSGEVSDKRTDNATVNCVGGENQTGLIKLKFGTSRLELGDGIVSDLSAGNDKGLFPVRNGANTLPIKSTLRIPAGASPGEHNASTTLTLSYP